MLTPDDVREALRVCFDPELPVNIVDLGLVHSVELTPDPEAPGTATRFHARVELLRRTTDEVREAMLLGQVANRLAGIYVLSQSDVTLAERPAWTAEKISAAGRVQLGLDRTAKPGLVQITLPK